MKIDINKLQFGLDTFGDLAYHDDTNQLMTYEESLDRKSVV